LDETTLYLELGPFHKKSYSPDFLYLSH